MIFNNITIHFLSKRIFSGIWLANSQISESILNIEPFSKRIKYFQKSLVNYIVINIQIERLAIYAYNVLFIIASRLIYWFTSFLVFFFFKSPKLLKQLKSIFFFASPSSHSQIKM